MTGAERRDQLITVARRVFAERGFDGTTVEEIAARAKVSKPVVYEHFGGKEGLYAVVVDREMALLLERFERALGSGGPRELLEKAALVLLDYIENETDGFKVLTRDAPLTSASGTYSSLINDVASRVEHILDGAFKTGGFQTKLAGLYSQALVGMVAMTGQWWLEARKPKKDVVAAHLVNLAWNGLAHLDPSPELGVHSPPRRTRRRTSATAASPVAPEGAESSRGADYDEIAEPAVADSSSGIERTDTAAVTD